ncbi:MAG: heme-binding protein [Acetobacteraceae bacterium]|nr:heme-binding protein [Acetobacteraceae bacterium]
MFKLAVSLVAGLTLSTVAYANDASMGDEPKPCSIPSQTVNAVQATLATVVQENNGGLFSPNLMWSAVVDRSGTLCSVIKTGDAWPGSRAIAMAKAFTANGFSNSKLAISTANLYAPTQPGGSLQGLAKRAAGGGVAAQGH